MRPTFAKELERYLDDGKDVVLLTADLGYSVFEELQAAHPNCLLNMGVAENTMVGFAAGLAMTGAKVFCYGISKFVANKSFEQIREDICLHGLPVVLVGTGAGVSYGEAGFSHFSTEDIGCMRTLPGLTILSPADPVELKLLLAHCLHQPGPVYLRLGKSGDKVISTRQSLGIGESYALREGADAAVIGYGNILTEALAAADMLATVDVHPAIISVPTIKPLESASVKRLIDPKKPVYVLEEHSEVGGLGDALSDLRPIKLAVPDRIHALAGSQRFLRAAAGIDASAIAARIAADLQVAAPAEAMSHSKSWGAWQALASLAAPST